MNAPNLSTVQWRKSSHSGTTGGECVEVAGLSSVVAMRDSKSPDGHVHTFGRAAFRTLMQQIRAGRHDR